MIDDAIRENGGLIGRRFSTLMDPWASSLVLAIPGYSLTPVTTSTGSTGTTTTLVQNDFASSVSPWSGQSATLSATGGELQVTPTSIYQGARWVTSGLTAGQTLTISGKVRVPDSGNSATVQVWDRSDYSTLLSQSYTAATATSFTLTATIPSSGSIDIALMGAQTTGSVYFDDLLITAGSGSTNTTVVQGMPGQDLTGRALTWTGGAIINNTASRFYGQSMAFAGTDRVSASIPALGAGDFIIDGFVYLSGGSTPNRGVFRSFNGALALETNASGVWSVIDGGTARTPSSGGTAALSTWTHFRLSRVGNTAGLLLGGQPAATWATTANLGDGTFTAGCGGDASYSKPLAGRLQDLLVYRGVGSLEPFAPPSVGIAHRNRRYPSIITRL